eukprot:15344067-Alexandrium_andersonii.AAC.1
MMHAPPFPRMSPRPCRVVVYRAPRRAVAERARHTSYGSAWHTCQVQTPLAATPRRYRPLRRRASALCGHRSAGLCGPRGGARTHGPADGSRDRRAEVSGLQG